MTGSDLKAPSRLACVGLGALGLPMAANLHRAGYSLQVHPRSRSAENDPSLHQGDPAAATLCCASPADAVQGCQALVLCVSDDAAVEAVLWGDNGFHLGEKLHWRKFVLWEEATRIPFLFSVPGFTKGGPRCSRPVDTLCVFPTLIELCGLNPLKNLDGVSIVPLLKNPEMTWDLPAVTEYKRGQCAVRSEQFRYIRYSDGTEELYDRSKDPNEWTNLAADPLHAEVKKRLAEAR